MGAAALGGGAAPCPSCGAPLGGRAGCQAAFDACCAAAWASPSRAAVHTLVVDAYCLQHPEDYCVSAKSYAAHLAGLACGVLAADPGATPPGYFRIARWLDGGRALERPEPPPSGARGAVTIAALVDVGADAAFADPAFADAVFADAVFADAVFADAVRRWAHAVWAAYGAQHATARAWLAAAGGA